MSNDSIKLIIWTPVLLNVSPAINNTFPNISKMVSLLPSIHSFKLTQQVSRIRRNYTQLCIESSQGGKALKLCLVTNRSWSCDLTAFKLTLISCVNMTTFRWSSVAHKSHGLINLKNKLGLISSNLNRALC